LSQGGLIGRYIVESCETKYTVRNLVTIGTPNNGIDFEENCHSTFEDAKKKVQETASKAKDESVDKAKEVVNKVKDSDVKK